MKFSDFFVPKYLHSDPAVRMKFVSQSQDAKLMEQMAQNEADEKVKQAAASRAKELKGNRQMA